MLNKEKSSSKIICFHSFFFCHYVYCSHNLTKAINLLFDTIFVSIFDQLYKRRASLNALICLISGRYVQITVVDLKHLGSTAYFLKFGLLSIHSVSLVTKLH